MKKLFIVPLSLIFSMFFFLNTTFANLNYLDSGIYNEETYRYYNPDLQNMTSQEIRDHWINYGLNEGRRASFTFSVNDYREHYPYLSVLHNHNHVDLAQDYLVSGRAIGRVGVHELSPLVFNLAYYKSIHNDMTTKADDYVLAHWVRHGISEGRRGSPFFVASEYADSHLDLKSYYGSNYIALTRHFVRTGEGEGRSGLKAGLQDEWQSKIKAQSVTHAIQQSSDDIIMRVGGADGENIVIMVKVPPKTGKIYTIPLIPEAQDASVHFENHINLARADGDVKHIHVQTGTYHFRTKRGNSHINLYDLNNVTFDGGGSAFKMYGDASAVRLRNLNKVQISNFSVEYTNLQLFSRGTIVNHNGVKVLSIDPGYLKGPGVSVGAVSQYNFTTNEWIRHLPGQTVPEVYFDSYDPALQPVYDASTGVYKHANLQSLGVGSSVLVRHRVYNWHGIVTENDGENEDIHLVNITLYNSPGMGFVLSNFKRGARVENCKIKRKLASTIGTVSSDGLHFGNNGGDIIVRGNSFEYQGDDAVNTAGRSSVVNVINGERTIFRMNTNNLVLNNDDELAFFNVNEAYLGSAKVQSFGAVGSEFNIILDRSLPFLTAGLIVRNVNRMGSRFLIENNTFRKNRARGILIQSPNGVVRNNTIDSPSMNGMIIGSTSGANTWFEGFSSSNLLFLSNTIMSPGAPGGAAITVRTFMANNIRSPLRSNKSVVFHSNVLTDVPSPCFLVSGVTGIAMVGNTCSQRAGLGNFQLDSTLLNFMPKAYFLEGRNLEERENNFVVTREARTWR